MTRFFSSRLFWLAALAISISGFVYVGYWDWTYRDWFEVARLSSAPNNEGTKNHLEQEHKLRIENFSPFQSTALKKSLSESLASFIQLPNLQAPNLVNQPYRIRDGETPFVFLDFYLDTDDFKLDSLNLAYRLRYRWKSVPDFIRFINGGRNAEDLPLRCEVQCKFQRRDGEEGLRQSFESRFEFRDQRDPLSAINPVPLPPWPFPDFVRVAQKGVYQGTVIGAARECATVIHQALGVDGLHLQPQMAILDIRTRSHLLIKTPSGTGPMPDDAYTISLDEFWYTRRIHALYRKLALGDNLPSAGLDKLFFPAGAELELEFERNVATGVRQIASAKPGYDTKDVEGKFMNDLNLLKTHLADGLNRRGFTVESKNQSKLKQVLSRIRGSHRAL